jgi:hypothetical protein
VAALTSQPLRLPRLRAAASAARLASTRATCSEETRALAPRLRRWWCGEVTLRKTSSLSHHTAPGAESRDATLALPPAELDVLISKLSRVAGSELWRCGDC